MRVGRDLGQHVGGKLLLLGERERAQPVGDALEVEFRDSACAARDQLLRAEGQEQRCQHRREPERALHRKSLATPSSAAAPSMNVATPKLSCSVPSATSIP